MEASSVAPEPADTSEGTARAASGASPRAPAGVLPPPPLPRGRLLLRTLGMAEIHLGGAGVITPLAERMFSLLALTAMAPDHVIARDDVLALVWSDADEPSARHSLRQHLYKLRNWGVPIRSTGATVLLAPEGLAPSFALERTAALFDRDVLRGGEPFGHLFAGWVPTHAPMRRWVEDQRDRFQMDVRRILVPELRRLRDRADWVECERWARTVLEFDPYNEDGMLVLAEAIAMQGGRHSARAMLDGYVRETGLAGTELAQDVEAAQRRISRATRVRHEAAATPTLVGRDDELRRLDALTLAALQGQTQVVHLTGPAGIGKTELAYEATRRAVILGFTRCIIRVTRPMGQIPLGMLSRLVRDLLRLPGALGCRPEVLRALQLLAGTADESAEVQVNPPRQLTLTECLAELFRVVVEEAPLVLLLDDPKLADFQSLELFNSSLELLGNVQVLLLLTVSESSVQTSSVRRLPHPREVLFLRELSLPSCVTLASQVVSSTGRRLTPEEARIAASVTDRSPMHVIAAARDSLTRGIADLPAQRLRDSLRTQIDSLPNHARHALHTIAVLGGDCRMAEAASIIDLSLPERLDAFRILAESGLAADEHGMHIRIHETIRDVAIDGLTALERRVIATHAAHCLAKRLDAHFEIEPALLALSIAEKSADQSLAHHLCMMYAEKLAAAGHAKQVSEAIDRVRQTTRHPIDRARLLESQLKVSRIASDWRRAIAASVDLSNLRSVHEQGSPSTELIEIEAKLRADLIDDGERNAARALEIACTPSLSTELRLRAARLVISTASDLFNRSLAHAAFAQIQEVYGKTAPSTAEAEEAMMQYHAIFGDQSESLRIARRLADGARNPMMSADAARMASNAAYALRLGGETRIAYDTLVRVIECDALQGAPGRRAFAAWQLSLIDADRDEPVAALSWAAKLSALLEGETDHTSELWFTNHTLRMELLANGAIESGALLLSRIERERGQPSRSMLYCLALALRARDVQKDSDTYGALIDDSVHHLAAFGSFAGMDLLYTSVCESLIEAGRIDTANAITDQYFGRDRRERGIPAYTMNRLPSSLRARIVATSAR